MSTTSSDQRLTSRGRLLTARQIATEIFSDPKRERWVRQTVAPESRLILGHSTVMWWEQDVLNWLDSKRERT